MPGLGDFSVSNAIRVHKTGFSAADIPDLNGKTALVTGGNTGIGYQCCLELCRKGALVIMASRSEQRAQEAIDAIQKELNGSAKIEFLSLDLMNLSQVKEAAETFLKMNKPLDILMNNAGIMACPYGLTKDGFESQFGTNHMGHFLLTHLLVPSILKAPNGARIVTVSSAGHAMAAKTGIDYQVLSGEPDAEKAMDSWARYGVSKLSNILFTKELAKRYGGANGGVIASVGTILLNAKMEQSHFGFNLSSLGVVSQSERQHYIVPRASAVHPGVVRTELLRGPLGTGFFGRIMGTVSNILMWPITLSASQGALTSLYCGTCPAIASDETLNGAYFVPIAFKAPDDNLSSFAKDEKLAKQLWDFSEKVLREKGLLTASK